MAEDVGLCTEVEHHQQKLVLFLAAMRSYADALREQGMQVHYERLVDDGRTYEERLAAYCEAEGITAVTTWEIADRFFAERIAAFCESHGLALRVLPSPMFVTPSDRLDAWFSDHRAHMADFYKWQRRRMEVLVDAQGQPFEGQWSFDADNRESLPDDVALPGVAPAAATEHVREVIELVAKRFAHHPGELSVEGWWLATTRDQALAWLESFVQQRLGTFGPYEDALTDRDPFVFHAVLTPMLNTGLLTPGEVLRRVLRHAEQHEVPIASLEGFVRQLIGWREFIRGVDRAHGPQQGQSNSFGHTRGLTEHWYAATTGLPPLDDVIDKAQRWGWTHHIERLMVAANVMTLCEIEPRQAYGWFMELFVDSAHWVMGPNVYGMGIFSDGGIFATKPYVCGSNYLRKMGPYGKGEWCDVLDGLYWRFIDNNRDFIRGQARLAQVVGTFDRMKPTRRDRIFTAADRFLQRVTEPT